jgi:serine/threonine protein kinase/WD40 repeat protein
MTEASRLEEAALPLSHMRRIDAVCLCFEKAWKASLEGGNRPRIEDFLGNTPESERAILRRELIALDIDYRRRAGEQPQAEEYQARFSSLDLAQVGAYLDTQVPTLPHAMPQLAEKLPAVPGYEILGELGRGGMGVVYQAWQTDLHRLVALKMVLAGAHASTEELTRFRTEAEAVARLQHPNIVQIYEIGQLDRHPYMALEYVEGGNLAQKLQGNPLPVCQAAQWVATLARAVHYAHQRGIVHRDLKPANILLQNILTAEDAEERRGRGASAVPLRASASSAVTDFTLKLTDFGLARLQIGGGPTLTYSGQFLGTPGYSAPEQAAGKIKEIGPATDVYALGTILYELLTGRPPFKAETPQETLAQVQSQEPVSPSRLRPKLPRDLSTICLKCLEKEPGKRYASAEALADDLDRFLAGEPIQARPVSSTEKLWRWCRRNPAVATLMGFVAVLLVLLAAGSMVAAVWLHADRDRAEQAERAAKEKLWQSYKDQARAGRLSRRVGQRLASLQVVEKAIHLARELSLPNEWILELRNEAIACLALPDLGVAQEWGDFPARSWAVTFDVGLERYIRLDDRQIASLRRTADDEEVCRFRDELRGEGAWLFSSDGRFLAREFGGQLKLWKLNGTEPSLVRDKVDKDCSTCAFRVDSRRLAIGRLNRSLDLLDLTTGEQIQRLELDGEPRHVAFHPTAPQLAIAFRDHVQVYDLDTRAKLAEFRLAADAWPHVAWHPDGKTLAMVGGDGVIVLRDVTTNKLVARLEENRGGGITLTFNHAGDLLASVGWAGILRLWEPRTGRQLLSTRADMTFAPRFSRDDRFLAGQRIGNKLRILEVTGTREYRTLADPLLSKSGVWAGTISPDRRLFAAALAGRTVGFWDLQTGEELASIRVAAGVRSVLFEPSGTLLTGGPGGLWRWPIRADASDPGRLRIGPPQELRVTGSLHQIAQSQDGHVIASAQGNGASVFHWDGTPPELKLSPHPGARYIAVSPDGRWVATGSHGASFEVRVSEAATGKSVKDLPVGHASHVAFSPDGQWLATCGDSLRVWEVGSWQERFRLEGPPRRTDLAFSPDSKLLAYETGEGIIRLINPENGQEYARLEDPDQDRAAWITFSPDGTRLVAAAGDSGSFHVWDLRLIRTWLEAQGLDWDLPPYPPPHPTLTPGQGGEGRVREPAVQGEDALPLRITVDYAHAVLTNPRQAVGVYSVAIVLNPINPEAYFYRGRAHGRLRESQEAIADYSMFLALAAPDDTRRAEALFRRSNNCRTLNQRAAWLADLLQLRELNLDPIREFQGDLASRFHELARRLVTGPGNERDPAKAQLLAQKALELTPSERMYQNTLAITCYRLGQYEKAMECLERNLRESTGEVAAYDLFFLALCRAGRGEMTEAKGCYDRALHWIEEQQNCLSAQAKEELATIRAEVEAAFQKATPNRSSGS